LDAFWYKGLAPKNPESMALMASKLMINRLKELLEQDKSFAFETTGAGKNYLNHLKMAKSKGYEILLVFLWLDSPEQAIKRVAQRVKQGGHHIPEDVIFRRYYAGLSNLLTHYLPIADTATIVNNSPENSTRNLVAKKSSQGDIEILNGEIWTKINKAAYER
jgi:predicted ABC-type ATPase